MLNRWLILAFFVTLSVTSTLTATSKNVTTTTKETDGKKETVKKETVKKETAKKGNEPAESKFNMMVRKVGNIINKFILKPLTKLLMLMKALVEKTMSSTDKFINATFGHVLKVMAKVFNLSIIIPLKLLNMLGKLAPNFHAKAMQALETRLTECNQTNPTTPVKEGVEKMKECIKEPLNSIFTKKMEMINKTLEVFEIVKVSIEDIQNSTDNTRLEKIMRAMSSFMDKAMPKISDVLNVGVNLWKEYPKILHCFVGDQAKNLVNKTLDYMKGYLSCVVGSQEKKKEVVEKKVVTQETKQNGQKKVEKKEVIKKHK